jgi:hypothetical protein
MKATVKDFLGQTEVNIEVTSYANNKTLAIQLWCEDGPFATLTVNIEDAHRAECQYVDTNNCPWAEHFIQEYNLGAPTGNYGMSGFCLYPEYRFDIEELKKYAL